MNTIITQPAINSKKQNKGPEKCTSTKCRYQRIQIMGMLFVILSVILLSSKIFLGDAIDANSKTISISGKQGILAEKLTNSILRIESALVNSNLIEAKELQTEFQKSHGIFDQTLKALKEGGETKQKEGRTSFAKPLSSANYKDSIDEISKIWINAQSLLEPIISEEVRDISIKDVNAASNYLLENNQDFLGALNALSSSIERDSENKSIMQQVILWMAIVLTIGLFIYLTVFAINGLRKRDSQLDDSAKTLELNYNNLVTTNATLEATQVELHNSNYSLQDALESVQQASIEAQSRANELQIISNDLSLLKEESDTIFDAVDHGLCLLNKSAIIGSRVSKATYSILETNELVNKSFIDLMQPLITEKDLKTLESYIKLQFKKSTKKKQLEKYNPLKALEVTMNWDGNNFKTKNLGFEFERIMDGAEVAAVLVTITDITETVILENELKRASEQQQRKTLLIQEVIQSDSIKLEKFLNQTNRALDEINSVLKEQGVDGDSENSSKKVLEQVYRHIHNIKGNASMLGLRTIVRLAHDVESNLADLRMRPSIKGEEFLSALLQLGAIREYLEYYQEITDDIMKDFTGSTLKAVEKEPYFISQSEQFATEITDFSQNIAKEKAKKIYNRCEFKIDNVTPEGKGLLRDILVQLTRNSIVHGIESPEKRIENGKPEEGTISIICKKDDTNDNILNQPIYSLTYRDDGAGINLNNVKKQAIKLNIISEEDASSLSDMELTNFIFKSSLSTAKEIDDHGGRGVGLDIVKDKVMNELGGKIFIKFVPGNYTQFNFLVPVAALENTVKEKIV